MYGDTEFQKCLELYTSNKCLPPIAAGSKVRLKFIAARALIRSFTVSSMHIGTFEIEHAKVILGHFLKIGP